MGQRHVVGQPLGRLIDRDITIVNRHIGDTVGKCDVVDRLTGIAGQSINGRYRVIADTDNGLFQIVDVIHLAIGINDIDVGVQISNKQQLVLPVIINLGNLTARQLIMLIQHRGLRG